MPMPNWLNYRHEHGGAPPGPLADDCPGIVVALERLLSPECDVVATVTDGGGVSEACHSSQPDVVVLDLNMPNVGGLDVCRQLLQTVPQVRVILLSADTSALVRERALSLGAFAVVAKQQLTDLLLSRIKEAMHDSAGTPRY